MSARAFVFSIGLASRTILVRICHLQGSCESVQAFEFSFALVGIECDGNESDIGLAITPEPIPVSQQHYLQTNDGSTNLGSNV